MTLPRKPELGVCYYPEHWPRAQWREDAKRMARLGLTQVRIGEFAWSRLEPSPGRLEFDWLDKAISVLTEQGLNVILGTPTATPPRWMLDTQPDMLALDAAGRPRGFGSRRHYCFSHRGYFEEAKRITALLAERFGNDGRVSAWQIDNEYGCHDTVLSYSMAARRGFQEWLAAKYGGIGALNTAWGNVFWSMDYQDFSQIGLPNETVTTPNPAHAMDFHRYSSDMVVRFNQAQAAIIRAHSPAPVLHNYMGGVTDFDHFAVGGELDIAGWDSYPTGFLLDRVPGDAQHRQEFLRQGDPDYQAFHHDLYRGVGRGRMWVMEQQPGPVNWAPWNTVPLPGMARLWSLEAIAHGAELVSFFRWRQLPFGQEQMHSGLLRADGEEAPVMSEIRALGTELQQFDNTSLERADVALIFDYASAWAWQIEPQGADFSYLGIVFAYYRALRRFGINIDIVSAETSDLNSYRLVVAPGLFSLGANLGAALSRFEGLALLGPRFNAKTADFAIPTLLPPALSGFDLRVSAVETLPPGATVPLEQGGAFGAWFEHLETGAEIVRRTQAGQPALVRQGGLFYIAGWGDADALDHVLGALLSEASVATTRLPQPLRQRMTRDHRFIFNYGAEAVDLADQTIPAAGVIWQKR